MMLWDVSINIIFDARLNHQNSIMFCFRCLFYVLIFLVFSSIDEIILFNSLSKKDLFKIIDLQLRDLKNNLNEKNNSFRISKTAKEYLIRDGSHREWGARPLRRLIQNAIENKISNKFIKGVFRENALITIKAKSDRLIFSQFKKKIKKSRNNS